MFINGSIPPQKVQKSARLTDELRSMQPGQSVILDKPTAAALISHIRYFGGEARRHTISPNKVQVWRIS